MTARKAVLAVWWLALLACGTSAPVRPVSDDMVRVPAGVFIAGCDPAQRNDCDDEMPYGTATTAEIEIDRLEVTIGAYRRCIEAGPCRRAIDDVMARNNARERAPDDQGPTFIDDTDLDPKLPAIALRGRLVPGDSEVSSEEELVVREERRQT